MFRVEAPGLGKARRQLATLDASLNRELRESYGTLADSLVPSIRASAVSQGSTLARIAPSIRGGATAAAAFIALGGGHPEAMGAVFGSRRFKQFKPPVREGYVVYPTLRQRRSDIERHMEGTVERVLRPTMED